VLDVLLQVRSTLKLLSGIDPPRHRFGSCR
jgi:hypothetical protein